MSYKSLWQLYCTSMSLKSACCGRVILKGEASRRLWGRCLAGLCRTKVSGNCIVIACLWSQCVVEGLSWKERNLGGFEVNVLLVYVIQKTLACLWSQCVAEGVILKGEESRRLWGRCLAGLCHTKHSGDCIVLACLWSQCVVEGLSWKARHLGGFEVDVLLVYVVQKILATVLY